MPTMALGYPLLAMGRFSSPIHFNKLISPSMAKAIGYFQVLADPVLGLHVSTTRSLVTPNFHQLHTMEVLQRLYPGSGKMESPRVFRIPNLVQWATTEPLRAIRLVRFSVERLVAEVVQPVARCACSSQKTGCLGLSWQLVLWLCSTPIQLLAGMVANKS